MIPTIVCFYTVDNIYEQEAARLRASLDRLGLRHDLRPVESRGSWAANAGMTAGFLCDMLDEHKGQPIVYLNADAVVWKRPVLFEGLSDAVCDIAAHRTLRRGQLCNGTLWLANSELCRKVIADYRRGVEASPGDMDEQRHLDIAIRANPSCREYGLPEAYCLIHDLMKTPVQEAVIEHLQCSRTQTGSSLLPGRIKRLKELGE
jgi:hypothetical protein